MAGLTRNHPRKLAAVGVIAAAVVFADYLPNPMRTPGVKNIEKRYSSGGASPTQTPGVATKRGNAENAVGNVEKSKGTGTPSFQKEIDEQKDAGGATRRKISDMSYGDKSGK